MLEPIQRNIVSVQIITNENIDNDEFKIKLFKNLFTVMIYQAEALGILDRHIIDKTEGSMWDIMYDHVVDLINVGDEISERLASLWSSNFMFLDAYADKKKVVSRILYEYTKKDKYLPQQAVDVFLF